MGLSCALFSFARRNFTASRYAFSAVHAVAVRCLASHVLAWHFIALFLLALPAFRSFTNSCTKKARILAMAKGMASPKAQAMVSPNAIFENIFIWGFVGVAIHIELKVAAQCLVLQAMEQNRKCLQARRNVDERMNGSQAP